MFRFEYVEDIEPPNRGFQVDSINMYRDNVHLGYLKVAYVPKARLKQFVPTVYHYMSKFGGRCSLILDKLPVKPDLTDPEVWRGVVGVSAENYIYHHKVPPPVEQRLKEIEETGKQYTQRYRIFKHWHVDKPHIDYIKIFEEHRRKGYGTALYIAGAKELARRGFCLYASSCQSYEAKSCWAKMSSLPELPINREKTIDRNHPWRIKMDFRQKKTSS